MEDTGNKRKRWRRKASLKKEGFSVDGGDNFQIYVRYTLHAGRVVDFAVVLNIIHKGTEIQVARYDHAHGYTHIDLLDLQGRVDRKEYRDHIPVEQAIRHALDDFKTNWEDYAARCFGSQADTSGKEDRRPSRNRGRPRKKDAS